MARKKSTNARPEVLAFLADAKEHPEDDTPRLVLADWLDEHGNDDDGAWGELLRTQCRLARLPTEHPEWGALHARAQELLRTHGPGWKKRLGAAGEHASFQRGLVRLHLFAASNVEKAAHGRLPTGEDLAWVEHVAVHGDVNLSVARALASSPLFEHLASFHLSNPWGRTRKGLEILGGASFLARVRALQVDNLQVNQLASFLAAANFGGLQTLNVRSLQDGAGATRVLAGCPALAGLRALGLASVQLDSQAIEPLAGSPFLRSLETLHLRHVRLKNDALEALADGPILDHLTTLDLADNLIGAAGVQALADSPRSANLTALLLVKNQISTRAAGALAHSPHLRGLQSLDLQHNSLGPGGARALAEGKWPRLRHLHLAFTELGSEGAKTLAACPGLRALRELHLESNHLDDEAVRALIRSPHLRDLETLTVYDEDISEAGYRMVRERFGEGRRE